MPEKPVADRSWNWAVALVGLLVLPALALGRLGLQFDVAWLLAALAAVSSATVVLYAFDKRNAKTAGGRVPEVWLHLAALAGGWAVALAAQQLLRHKTRKLRFQVVFWVIVAFWQLAALEILRGAPLTRAVWAWWRAIVA